MKYSSNFLGWLGKTAKDYTYDTVHDLASTLATYYKDHSSSGQKLAIGYDSRFLAKEFADYIAAVMASYGVKVFLSNRIVPSPVLIFSSLHKKCMGTLVVTADDLGANYLGIRAFDSNGYEINEDKLCHIEVKKKKNSDSIHNSVSKWIEKGFIEPFDPSICYENHVDVQIDFSSMTPSVNRIMFNPLYGSGMLYFDRILGKNKVHGYTVDNDVVSDFKGIEPVPNNFIDQLYDDMIKRGAEIGFIVSPDCSSFEFLFGAKRLSVLEIAHMLLEHLMSKSDNQVVVTTNEYSLNAQYLNKLGLEFMMVDKDEFSKTIKAQKPLLSIDHLGRFYFEFHGSPDALMAGYYLVEILNNVDLTPIDLLRKFEEFNSLQSN